MPQATRIAPLQQGGGFLKEQVEAVKHTVSGQSCHRAPFYLVCLHSRYAGHALQVGDRVKEMVKGIGRVEDLKPDHGGIVKTKDGSV
jgi:hypothetical protein